MRTARQKISQAEKSTRQGIAPPQTRKTRGEIAPTVENALTGPPHGPKFSEAGVPPAIAAKTLPKPPCQIPPKSTIMGDSFVVLMGRRRSAKRQKIAGELCGC